MFRGKFRSATSPCQPRSTGSTDRNNSQGPNSREFAPQVDGRASRHCPLRRGQPSENQCSSDCVPLAPRYPASARLSTALHVSARLAFQLSDRCAIAAAGLLLVVAVSAQSLLSIPVNPDGSFRLPPGSQLMRNEIQALAGTGVRGEAGDGLAPQSVNPSVSSGIGLSSRF